MYQVRPVQTSATSTANEAAAKVKVEKLHWKPREVGSIRQLTFDLRQPRGREHRNGRKHIPANGLPR